MKETQHCIEYLLKINKEQTVKYKQNLLLNLMTTDILNHKENRDRLLSAIQTFSNYFQKAVQLRSVLTEDSAFYHVAQEHLKEEFLHNEKLLEDRHNKLPFFDPILEATSTWFAWKMLTLNDEERHLLVHLVLEASAAIFFREADAVMQHFKETDYFSIHNELDEEHEKLGIDLLYDLPPRKYERLLSVQKQGWAILNTACERIAIITWPEIPHTLVNKPVSVGAA